MPSYGHFFSDSYNELYMRSNSLRNLQWGGKMNHIHIKHIKIWHIIKLIDQIYPSEVFSLKTWNIENKLRLELKYSKFTSL